MIAIITSTIFPDKATSTTLYRTAISPLDRLNQTIATIQSLQKQSFEEIYLFDNSGFNWDPQIEDRLLPAKIIKFNTYQYQNKGLSEILMLLHGLSVIPNNKVIFKISGRYTLTEKLDENTFDEFEFAGKFFDQTLTTRGYYIKNKELMKDILNYALNFMYAYQHKIVGFRSLIKVIKNAFFTDMNTIFYESSISIEHGIYAAIQAMGIKVKNLEKIHVTGVSGHPTDKNLIINE